MKLKEQLVFSIVWKNQKKINPNWASVYNATEEEMIEFVRKHADSIHHVAHSLPGAYKNLDELKRHKDWVRGTLQLEHEWEPTTEDDAIYYDDIRMIHYYEKEIKDLAGGVIKCSN